MNFHPLPVAGSYLIEPEMLPDERGFFARTWCSKAFGDMGLNPDLRQCSISFNETQHTLRGMHYQQPPHEETKLVRCTQGSSFHVLVDLRDDSDTFLKWASTRLSAENRNLIYVPEGVAHGFLTLQEATEIFYQISEDYVPESAAGVRWNDPAFRIAWPADPAVISRRDGNYADFKPREQRPGTVV